MKGRSYLKSHAGLNCHPLSRPHPTYYFHHQHFFSSPWFASGIGTTLGGKRWQKCSEVMQAGLSLGFMIFIDCFSTEQLLTGLWLSVPACLFGCRTSRHLHFVSQQGRYVNIHGFPPPPPLCSSSSWEMQRLHVMQKNISGERLFENLILKIEEQSLKEREWDGVGGGGLDWFKKQSKNDVSAFLNLYEPKHFVNIMDCIAGLDS